MSFVPDRPETYDETKFWDEAAGTWTGDDEGGGRYKSYLVIVGQDSDRNGVIYFSES